MTWKEYLQERTQEIAGTLSVSSVGLVIQRAEGKIEVNVPVKPCRSIPLKFGDDSLGELLVELPVTEHSEMEQKIAAASAELAAFLHNPDWDLAVPLDQRMAQFKKEFSKFDWCGIYVVRDKMLHLSCFRGAPSPHTIIPLGQGICGAAVTENRSLNIPDVQRDPRYLSCDYRTKSEIVVPIRNPAGEAVAEIDIDSHLPDAFNAEDVTFLERAARELSQLMVF